MRKVFLILLIIGNCLILKAQNETGKVLLRNFAPKEYAAAPQNWCFAQDNNGIVYIGNSNGVMEYDGSTWRIIPIANKTTVRSLASDSAGTIFVGSVGDIGYLQPDNTGLLKYISLSKYIDSTQLNFTNVWNILISEPFIYFHSFEKILRYNKQSNEVKVIVPPNKFSYGFFQHNGTLYASDSKEGLCIINENGELIKQKDGAFFTNDNKLRYGMSVSKDTILIASFRNIFYYLPNSENPIQQTFTLDDEIKGYLKENGIYTAAKIGTEAAICFNNNGTIIFNNQKKGIHFNTDIGLQDNDVLKVQPEKNGTGMWMCLSRGICRADYPASLTYWDEKSGLSGNVNKLVRYKGTVYVATNSGVYYLSTENVVPVKGLENTQCWSIFTFNLNNDTLLLAGNNDGVYEIKNNKVKLLAPGMHAMEFYQSHIKTNRLYITWSDRVTAMDYENGTWKNLGQIADLKNEIRSIAEDNEGNLWLGTFREGIYKVVQSNEWTKPKEIKLYNQKNGFVSLKNILIYNINNELVFASGAGLFRYNKTADNFEYDTRFGKELTNNSRDVFFFLQDNKKQIWLSGENIADNHIKIGRQNNDGTWEWNEEPLIKIPDMFVSAIFLENNGIAWIGGSEGLYRYNPNILQNFNAGFNTLIRKIRIGTDSIIYFGGGNISNFKNLNDIEIDYKYNTLNFQYCATDYQDEGSKKYSFWLIGNDETWSDWISDSKKEYTNLREGTYTFCIKSKNVYGKEGSTAKFTFTILPPWYRAWWAYTIYGILFIGAGLLILRFYTQRLRHQKMHLEQIVKERTAEILQQKEEILSTLELVNQQKEEIQSTLEIVNEQKDELQSQNEQINKQKTIIEKKNKSITASITYASRIQKAILPRNEILTANFSENFIIFKPKDIVSGDFYFIKQIDNYLLIAVADCTGHGVPGAFMSMLGSSLLNEIVRKKEVTTASEVLNQLRDYIKLSLQQTGKSGEQQDGMDIAFCSINLQNLKMQYAGANSPLWIVRKDKSTDEYQIISHTADRMPIGIFPKEKPFINNEIQMETGDQFYLFSDGYESQFGGEKGDKLKTKRMQDIFIEMASQPMHEQKEILEQKLVQWKGELWDQIDDILIIGIKI